MLNPYKVISPFFQQLTFGIKRLIDGMELNSIAFLHARIAAFVADCRSMLKEAKVCI